MAQKLRMGILRLKITQFAPVSTQMAMVILHDQKYARKPLRKLLEGMLLF